MKSIGFQNRTDCPHGDMFRWEFENPREFASFLEWSPAIYKEIVPTPTGWFVDVWCSEAWAEITDDEFQLELGIGIYANAGI